MNASHCTVGRNREILNAFRAWQESEFVLIEPAGVDTLAGFFRAIRLSREAGDEQECFRPLSIYPTRMLGGRLTDSRTTAPDAPGVPTALSPAARHNPMPAAAPTARSNTASAIVRRERQVRGLSCGAALAVRASSNSIRTSPMSRWRFFGSFSRHRRRTGRTCRRNRIEVRFISDDPGQDF